jgi:hypothetical protein
VEEQETLEPKCEPAEFKSTVDDVEELERCLTQYDYPTTMSGGTL